MAELLSHSEDPIDVGRAIAAARERVLSAGEGYPAQQLLLADLDEWSQCELGRWMLVHGGWDGRWTRYCVDHATGSTTGNSVLDFFLNESPGILATRERFGIFSDVLERMVGPGTVLLSVPCGLADDVLRLPSAGLAGEIICADLDPASLAGAAENAAALGLAATSTMLLADAWDLAAGQVVTGPRSATAALHGGVDVLTSNGLNSYVPEDDRVVALYASFRGALRRGGSLVVSAVSTPEEWDFADVPGPTQERLRGLSLINNEQWANFRSVATTTAQLGEAGFEVTAVHPDKRGIFPTFEAVAV